MASEKGNSGDSCEFEPDSNFFDNFWDGMDVLIDNCRDPKAEGSWIAGKSDEESDCSSGVGRMVIDLPSSPESRNTGTKESKIGERSDIKDVLTSRVLAQLEKSSTHRKNKDMHSFPSSQLVVDVLDRLKKSVQQKNESTSSNSISKPDISRSNYSISRADDVALQINLQKEISSNLSAESDEQKREPNETMNKLLKIFFSEKKLPCDEHPLAGSSRDLHDSKDKSSDKDKRKRKRHKKHKSSKSKEGEYSKKHRRHKVKSKKKKPRKDVEGTKTPDFSLESVSSEDEDDILNKQNSEEEIVPLDRAVSTGIANSPNCHEYVKQPDCEEGEVLSSSSDWESERVAKKRREDLKSLSVRSECLSPLPSKGPRQRRFENRRTPPSPPAWPSQRLRSEDHGRYIIRQMRSPLHHVRMSPWREQPSDRQRLRIPIPRLESLSPVPIPLRPRSPNADRLSSELPPPYTNSFGYPIEILPSRRIEHIPSYHRPRSPWEEVHESRHLYKSPAPIEIHSREVIACPPLRIERRFPPEPGTGTSERRTKSGLLSRCLQEIRHRSYRPGRFVYDSESKVVNSSESSNPIGRFSSPLYSSQSRMHSLSFTSPTVRHVGTNSNSLQKAKTAAVSVGCQTIGQETSHITEDQVQQIDPALFETSQGLSLISEVSKERSERSLTIHVPDRSRSSMPGNAAVSEVLEVTGTSKRYRTPVQSIRGGQDFIQEFVSRVSVSKTTNYPASSEGTLEMWKTIVSFRYPDLNEKEREQVVLVKSMEAGNT